MYICHEQLFCEMKDMVYNEVHFLANLKDIN